MDKLKSLLKANIVFDAFGTSIFGLGIGYYTNQYLGSKPSDILLSMGAAVFVGTSLSYFSSALCDILGSKKSLILVQTFQLATCSIILFNPNPQVSIIFIFFYFVLGRMLSPIRGTLPPAYFPKDDLLAFKASVRSGTLVAVALASATAWLIVLLWESKWHGFSILFIIIDLITFLGCLIATVLLPKPARSESPKKPFSLINLGRSKNLTWLIFLAGFSAAGICGAAVPFLLPALGHYGSTVLVCDFLAGIAIAKLSEYVINKYKKYFTIAHININLTTALILSLLSTFTIFAAATIGDINLKFTLTIISIFISEISLTILSINLWNAQYEYGPDNRRGAVVGFYSMSSSYGSALSPLIAAKIL